MILWIIFYHHLTRLLEILKGRFPSLNLHEKHNKGMSITQCGLICGAAGEWKPHLQHNGGHEGYGHHHGHIKREHQSDLMDNWP